MSDPIVIRTASPADIDEVVAIDDDACALYAQAGLQVDLGPEHPFVRAERVRWTQAARDGHVFLAVASDARAVGMLIMGRVDGAPYLDELAVRMRAMRRGIGGRLVARAIEWAAAEPLWLTTYAHVPWNRPFYEQVGFTVVPASRCPPGIVAVLDEQRRCLPDPSERIAMRRAVD